MTTPDSNIEIEIFDKEIVHKYRFMVSCKIPLYDYKKRGRIEDELVVNSKANRPEGKIAIIVIFKKL